MQPGLGKGRPRRCCRHGIVGEVPSRHTSQPLPLLRDRQMPPSLELVFDFAQLGSHPFRDGDALPHESPALGFAARVRKAKAVSLLPAARGRPLLQAARPHWPEGGGGVGWWLTAWRSSGTSTGSGNRWTRGARAPVRTQLLRFLEVWGSAPTSC